MIRHLSVLLCGLAVAGCGPADAPGPKLTPVRGTLHTADGKPAAGATVTLHPADGQTPATLPFALVGADGSFRVTSRTAGDGAPPGTYAVTAVWRSVTPADEPDDKLKGRYADPKKPLATVTVREDSTHLDPLTLKR